MLPARLRVSKLGLVICSLPLTLYAARPGRIVASGIFGPQPSLSVYFERGRESPREVSSPVPDFGASGWGRPTGIAASTSDGGGPAPAPPRALTRANFATTLAPAGLRSKTGAATPAVAEVNRPVVKLKLKSGEVVVGIPAGTLPSQIAYARQRSSEMEGKIQPLKTKFKGLCEKIIALAERKRCFLPEGLEGSVAYDAKMGTDLDVWEQDCPERFGWDYQTDEGLEKLTRIIARWDRDHNVGLTTRERNYLKFRTALRAAEKYLEQTEKSLWVFQTWRNWYDGEVRTLEWELSERTPAR